MTSEEMSEEIVVASVVVRCGIEAISARLRPFGVPVIRGGTRFSPISIAYKKALDFRGCFADYLVIPAVE